MPPLIVTPTVGKIRRHSLAVAALTLLLLAGCTSTSSTATTASLRNDAARPASARWLRTELYFGISLVGVPGSRAALWQTYLDQEVTPRFPDGLTVLDAYGQWLRRGSTAAPGQLISKVLVIVHEDTTQRNADIEALRLAWKKATGDESVLRVSQPADISF